MTAKMTKIQLEAELKEAKKRIAALEGKPPAGVVDQSGKRFQALIENSRDIIALIGADGTILYKSPSIETVMGYKPGELAGKNAAEMFHPEDAEKNSAVFGETLARPGVPINTQTRYRHKNGEWRWVDITANNLLNNPDVGAIVVNYRDVTEQRLMQEQLQKDESRYRSLFEESSLSLWEEDFSAVKKRLSELKKDGVTDLRGYLYSHPEFVIECASLVQVLDVNKATLRLFETDRKEDLLKKLDTVISHENMMALADQLLAFDSGQTTYFWEGVNYTVKGRKIQVQLHLSIVPGHEENLSRVIVSMTDVTKSRETEEAQKKTEIYYHSLFEQTHDAVFILDLEGHHLKANQRAANMLGYEPGELQGLSVGDTSAEQQQSREVVTRLLTGEHIPSYERIFRRKDGSRIPVEINVELIRDHNGNPLYIQSVTRDITERKEADQQLAESEARFRALIANTGDLILVIDADGRITFASPSCERIFGYKPEETIGRNFLEWVHPDDLPETIAAFQSRVLHSGMALQQIAVRGLHKDGSWKFVEALGTSLLDDPAIKGIVLNVRDITEQKRIELEKEALYEIMQGMAFSQNLTEFLGLVHYSIGRVIQAKNLFVSLYNPSTEMFEDVYFMDECDELIGPSKREKTLTSFIFRTGNPLLVTNEKFEELAAAGEVELVGADSQSWVGVPLKTAGKTIGVMVIQDYETPNLYSEKDLAFLASISGQVASAVERKQAEKRLHESEENYRLLIENVSEALYVIQYGQIVFANPMFEKIAQAPASELIGMNILNFIPSQADRLGAIRRQKLLLSGKLEKTQNEYKVRLRSGEELWVNVSEVRTIWKGELAVLTFATDVTGNKLAGETLRESEASLNRAQAVAHTGSWKMDVKRNIITWSAETYRIFGVTSETPLTYESFLAFIHPDDRDSVNRAWQAALEGAPYDVEHRIFVGEQVKWVRERAELETDTDGSVLRGIGTSQDITERKQANEILKESERRYRNLFEDSPISLWEDDYSAVKQKLDELRGEGVTDFETYFAEQPEVAADCMSLIKILDANQSSVKLFNAKNKAELLQNSNKLLAPGFIDSRELVNIANGVAHFEWEGVNRKLSGELIHVRLTWSIAPGHEDDLSKVLISITDITELKQVEEELRDTKNFVTTLLDLAPISIYVISLDNTFRLINRQWEEDSQIRREEALGHSMFEIFPATMAQQYQAQNQQVAESGASLAFEEWVETPNGLRWYYTLKFPLRDANGLLESIGGISLDITERKQADEKISKSERRYRSLFEGSPIPLWEEDFSDVKKHLDSLKQEGVTDFHAYFASHPDAAVKWFNEIRILDVNNTAVEMYQAENKERLIRYVSQGTSEGELEHVNEFLVNIANGKTSHSWEGIDETLTGQPIGVNLSWSVAPGHEHDFSKVIVTTVDITERKLANDKIKESEQRYRSLFEDSPISLWEEDFSAVKQKIDALKREGISDFEAYFSEHPQMVAELASLVKIVDVNKASVKLFKAGGKAELLSNLGDLITIPAQQFTHELIQISKGLTRFEREAINKNLNGEEIQVHLTWSVAPGYEEDFSKVIISIVDITESKQAGAEIRRQLSELETLYESGLAINRLLTPKEIAQKVIEILDRRMNWHHIAIRQYLPEANSVKLIGFHRPDISAEEAEEFIKKMNEIIANPAQGLSGWVTLHGTSLRVGNVKADERYVDVFSGILSGLYMPLKIGDRVIGSISVESEIENSFTEMDERLLMTLAGQAAIAIENANLFLMAQKEIVDREQAELLLQKDNQIMQLIASGDLSFHETLEAITKNIESLSRDAFCSILLLDEDGVHLKLGAAPSLPQEYNQAIDGVAIGESVGSCGTAAYRKETIIVSDIASDPLWVDYRELAFKYGLRSCWSTPIMDAQSQVLGTFAIYHPETYIPTRPDFKLIERATQQTKIVIERKRAEAALQKQTEELLQLNDQLEQRVRERTAEIEATRTRLELATDAAGLGIWEWDVPTGNLIWDAQMHRIYGVSPESFDGRIETQMRLIHPDDQGILLGVAQAIMKNQETNFKIEHRILHDHGDTHTLFEQGVAVFGPQGTLERIVGIVNDITRQKQAEQDLRESEAYSHLLFDAAPDPVSVATADGTMLEVNRLFEQQHRVQREAVRDKPLAELNIFPAEQLEKAKNYIAAIAEGLEIAPVELDFYNPGGGTHTLEMRSYPIEVKGKQLILSTSRDITIHKKAEESLRLANAEMERALRMKDEFLANMSHELRTPLNAVLGMSESLEEQIAGSLNEKQLKYIRTIRESGKHLLDLINDILDLSKIEAGRMELNISQVSVTALCEASLRMVKEQAQKKGLQTSLKIDPEVKVIMGDERRLKQSLVNLLSNAVKFTQNNKSVGVEVQGNTRNQTVTFTVWDEGIGMAPDKLNLIFKPFVQLDAGLAREFSGTGLGLVLVAQMIRLHGGSVSVESKEERGSRFSITLPWVDMQGGSSTTGEMPQQADTLSAGETGQPPKGKRGGKILIVEDTDPIIMLLSEYLRYKGYQVIAARNGMEGVKLAIQEKPDLILMDVMMPVMDGVEATKRIRLEEGLRDTPIIALTALAMQGDRERCLQAGMNDYLSKPVQMKELESLIVKHINKERTTPPA
ncbi:MAG: PAS domain S-box protein [Chloroflexota bacterium]